MSKNDVSASTSRRFPSKATSLSPRQSFLRRLTPPAPVSSISAPFLKPSTPPPASKTMAEKHARRSQQPTSMEEKKRKQQQPKGLSRLESVRLTLMASVSRRRARSTSEIPSKKQEEQLNKKMLAPSNNNKFASRIAHGNKNNRGLRSGSGSTGSRISANSNIEGDRLSLSAPPSSPRHFLLRRRPLSQFGGLARIIEDDNSLPWKRGTSTATTLSLDNCSTRSNSTRSSSSSSIRTISENNNGSSINTNSKNGAAAAVYTTTNNITIHNSKLFSKAPQKVIAADDPNKQPWEPPAAAPAPPPSSSPTPNASFSTSLYPTRLRGIMKSPASPDDAMPTLLPTSKSTTMVVPRFAQTTSVLLTSPANIQKKEDKAISVWRNTVSRLMSENSSTTTTIGSNHGHAPRPPFRPVDSSKDRRALCKFIMNELFTTEQSYQALLTLIQTRYMQPMMAVVNNNPLVKASDVAVLFRHLPEMITLSDKLLSRLELHAASLWRDICPGQVAEIFDTIQDDLAVFLKYAVHYQANLKSIRRACNNVLFIKIEQESLARRDTNRMGIADYLIAPFQRVPRYCLLIKDLMKHADQADPHQFARLHATLKLLTGLTMTMDHVQKLSR